MALNPLFLDQALAILGRKGFIDDPRDIAPHMVEWRGLYHGRTPFVAKPGNVTEVSELVQLCQKFGVSIVPQGGNTGLVGGGVPDSMGQQLLISTTRLNKIRQFEPLDEVMVVEAGVTLQETQNHAAEQGLLFPLSLAAEGSCTIGGNVSTNAGGVHVLRYGNMRDLVLGLEVVLPDGRIWNGLNILRKNNSGYDLKHLFIGAEGTLGIVTAAAVKLFPLPKDVVVAFVGLTDLTAALSLFRALRQKLSSINAVELIPRIGLDLVLRHIPQTQDPFRQVHPWYLLIELAEIVADDGLRQRFENVLNDAVEQDLIRDAVISHSTQQSRALWRLRESLSEAQKCEGASIKHDISVPISQIPAFMAAAEKAVRQVMPDIRIVAFGHVGDGNIHYNLSVPFGGNNADFLKRWGEFNRIVHELVLKFNGSISAEHGIGRLKKDELRLAKSPVEMDLFHRIKNALDPEKRMNPLVLL